MGSLFSKPKSPKPPELPPAPPTPPTDVSPAVVDARDQQKRAAQAAAGIASGDITKGGVDLQPANLIKKKLLGS